jgi:hypothetical protein
LVKEIIKKLNVIIIISLWSLLQFIHNKQFEAESTSGERVLGANLFIQNLTELPKYYLGIFGGRGPQEWPFGLGWFDTELPIIVPVLGALNILVVVIFILNKINLRQKIIVPILTLFMILIPLLILQLRQSHATYFLQPRYLIPLLIVFLGVLTIGSKSNQKRNIITNLIVVSLSIGNSVSLFTNLKRYTVGLDSETSFFSNVEWWWSIPITPGFTWVVGSLAFPIFIYLMLSRDNKSIVEIKK